MGACIFMNLVVSSRQMSVIPVDTAAGAEVNIQTFGSDRCWYAHTIDFPDL